MIKNRNMNISKTFVISVAMLLGLASFSCQAKNITTANYKTDEAITTPETIAQTEQNNGNGNGTEPECENLYGPDSLKTRQQTSLYREEFNRKNYLAALPSWRYVYTNAPCYKEYITADGAYLMSLLISQTKEKDTATIKAYADTLMEIYDTRLRLFGDNPNVWGRKGRDLFKYFPAKRKEAIDLMNKSMAGEGNNTYALVLSDLMLATVQENRENNKSISDDEVISSFDRIMTIVDHNLANYKKQYNEGVNATPVDTTRAGQNIRYWEWVESYVVALGSPYLTCEKLTELYKPRFVGAPDDNELVEKIITLLKRSDDCAKTAFYLQVAEQYFKLKPDADAAASLAKAFQDRNDITKAKFYYEKAAELATDKNKKVSYYLVLGSIELNARNGSQARSYARKALEVNPKSGDAYMLIGNAYLTLGAGCGETKVEKAYPYLAAYDKFVQAKSVDASVADQANSRMALAQKYWPKREDVFFENKEDGQTVNTGCWIGESTILRSIKE